MSKVYKNSSEKEQSLINEIIEHFDFEKCQKAMRAVGWTWYLEGNVPSVERLKESARDRLVSAMELAKKDKCSKSTYFSSSGGLKGNAWVNRYGHIEGIRLEFVLTEWDSDGDV
jgi:hypothetical protein